MSSRTNLKRDDIRFQGSIDHALAFVRQRDRAFVLHAGFGAIRVGWHRLDERRTRRGRRHDLQRDVLQGTSVLTGEALTRDLRPTIGETLTRLPGVSATSFGPAVSRPVLRGFQGERIRVLTDGIGSIDVSNTSVDHAVVIDPLLAERVEVLRGPAALLFGSSARKRRGST